MGTKGPKIGIAAPAHVYQYYSGGEFLVDKTVECLKALGTDVKLFDTWTDKIEAFDLIHFFGIGYFNYEFLNTVKFKGRKLAVTPIFPSMGGLKNILRSIYHRACFMAPMLKTPPELMRRNARLADILLAHANVEKAEIISLLGAAPAKVKVVHFGADKSFLGASPDLFVGEYKVKDFILCLARFDSTQKNQLNLIRALRDVPITTVFVGKPDKGMDDYYSICRKEASKDMIFIDHLDRASGMLGSCYAACRTFVVPSKFEYPALAGIEAVLAGCKRLAVTQIGSTREYYGTIAGYFNPYSIKDIKDVVLKVHNSEKVDAAAIEKFKNTYLWEKYAANVLEAYKSIL